MPSTRYSQCDDGGTLQQVQCLAAFHRELDAELNVVYQRALARMPKVSPQDDRKSREQLRRSQRAWLLFMRENCVLRDGQEGGSNLWVTYHAAICEEQEIQARIRFLEEITTEPGKP